MHLAAVEDSKRFDYRHGPAHMAEAQMGELLQRLYPYLFGKDPDVLIFFHYLHLPYFLFAFDRPVRGPARRPSAALILLNYILTSGNKQQLPRRNSKTGELPPSCFDNYM